MSDTLVLAMEVVANRREGKSEGPAVGELMARMDRDTLEALLQRAERELPLDTDRALRILKRAAKCARKGDGERTQRLMQAATALVGPDEVSVLAEEHRLSFIVHRQPQPPSRPKLGFAG